MAILFHNASSANRSATITRWTTVPSAACVLKLDLDLTFGQPEWFKFYQISEAGFGTSAVRPESTIDLLSLAKTYETTNLDEAAYIALQGYPFSVIRTAPVSARFVFSIDDRFEEARAQFWTGCAAVQLHQWLATRAALKNQVYGQAIPFEALDAPPIVPTQSDFEIRPGIGYWYREKETILTAVYGNRNPHTSRLAQGNFYRNREDAELKRNRVRLASSLYIASET